MMMMMMMIGLCDNSRVRKKANDEDTSQQLEFFTIRSQLHFKSEYTSKL